MVNAFTKVNSTNGFSVSFLPGSTHGEASACALEVFGLRFVQIGQPDHQATSTSHQVPARIASTADRSESDSAAYCSRSHTKHLP